MNGGGHGGVRWADNPWKRTVVERLQELWQRGDSADAVAAELSAEFGIALTKNSVIGKVGRLRKAGIKLQKRASPIKRDPLPVFLGTATPEQCRWPIGIPGRAMVVCGDETMPGKPYCERHCGMAYQKPDRGAA